MRRIVRGPAPISSAERLRAATRAHSPLSFRAKPPHFPAMENTEKVLTRDCEAIRIPSGETFILPAGARVTITQALGGSFTVALLDGYGGLARITDANADALGVTPKVETAA